MNEVEIYETAKPVIGSLGPCARLLSHTGGQQRPQGAMLRSLVLVIVSNAHKGLDYSSIISASQ